MKKGGGCLFSLNRTNKFLLLFFLFFIASLFWQEGSEGAKEKKLDYLKFGSPASQTLSNLPFVLGSKKGFYQQEGINLEIFLSMKSNIIIAGQQAGDLDYGGSAGSSITASAQGFPIKTIFVVADRLPHSLVSKSEIKKVTDLKGKVLGVSSLGSSEYFAAREIAKHYALDPDKDIKIIGVGHGIRLPVLIAGSVDATLLSPAYTLQAVKRGFKELVRVRDIVEIASIGVSVTDRKLKEKKDETKRMIRATLKAFLFVKDKRPESADFMNKEWGYSKGDAIDAYDTEIGTFTKNGISSDRSILSHIEISKMTGLIKEDVPLSKVADFSLLKEILKELGMPS